MLTLIAVSAALMQQAPAPPAPPEGRTRVMVMSEGPGGLDANGDGQITREEFAAPLNDNFARMDQDGDGRLSPAELTSGPRATVAGGAHDVMILGGPGAPVIRRFEVRREGPGAAPGEFRTMVFVGGEPGPRSERRIVIHGAAGPDDITVSGEWRGAAGEPVEIRRAGEDD